MKSRIESGKCWYVKIGQHFNLSFVRQVWKSLINKIISQNCITFCVIHWKTLPIVCYVAVYLFCCNLSLVMILWWRLRWHNHFNYCYQFNANEFWLSNLIWLQWKAAKCSQVMKSISFIRVLFDNNKTSRLVGWHASFDFDCELLKRIVELWMNQKICSCWKVDIGFHFNDIFFFFFKSFPWQKSQTKNFRWIYCQCVISELQFHPQKISFQLYSIGI